MLSDETGRIAQKLELLFETQLLQNHPHQLKGRFKGLPKVVFERINIPKELDIFVLPVFYWRSISTTHCLDSTSVMSNAPKTCLFNACHY
jgi:hypothetical protein